MADRMTHTTTDAAEARALDDHPCHGWFRHAGDRLTHRQWMQNGVLQPTCERCGTLIDREHKEVGPVCWEPPVGSQWRRAEAASGAGEREAGEPTLAREIAAQFFDKRDPLDRSFRDLAHNIRRGRYDDQDSVEIVRFTLAFVAREAASLPPATDPAMGLDPVTIERCAKVCEQLAAGCRAELKDPANETRTIAVLDGHISACTTLAANIRALAPTKGDV